MADERPPTPDTSEQHAAEQGPTTTSAATSAEKVDPPTTPDSLSGERYPTPRGPILTALMAVTGILLVLRAGRLLARVVLKYRQPAEVRVTDDGIRVWSRTEMLGKVLRDRVLVIPKGGLVRAVREIRYPRLGMYAGLFALALGSYLGVSLVVDGVRAASLSMIGMGAILALLGLGIDFALAILVPGSAGRCRIVLVVRRGPALCIGSVDPALADRLLARLNGA